MDMSVTEVTHLMHLHNISSVLIESPPLRFVFSVEDLLTHIQEGKSPLAPLSESRLTEIACIAESEHILAAMEALEKSGGRYLGVTDDNSALTGIATYTDILSAVDPTILVQKKTIGELVSRIEPVTFTPDWIFEDVLSHLRRMEDSIIVIDGKMPIGIITTKDVFKIISTGQSTSRPLSEYMIKPVITTQVSASIHDALTQLKQFHIKRSIVVNDAGHLVGVVTQSELVGFAYGTWMELIKYHAGELRELVSIIEGKSIGFEKTPLFDVQTGLGNRRMLEKRLHNETERVTHYQTTPFSMLLIKLEPVIQNQEQVDRLHEVELVKSMAILLTEQVKVKNDLFRVGSNKLALLLPYTSMEVAGEFAARISSTIKNHAREKQLSISVGLSIGQYSIPETAKEYFYRVNNRLESSGKQGLNRVVFDYAPQINA